nr:accripin11 [Pinna nobilis]
MRLLIVFILFVTLAQVFAKPASNRRNRYMNMVGSVLDNCRRKCIFDNFSCNIPCRLFYTTQRTYKDCAQQCTRDRETCFGECTANHGPKKATPAPTTAAPKPAKEPSSADDDDDESDESFD